MYHNRFFCAIHMQIQNNMRNYIIIYIYIIHVQLHINIHSTPVEVGDSIPSLKSWLSCWLISCILLRSYLTHQWCKPDLLQNSSQKLRRFTNDPWSQQCKTISKHLKASHKHPAGPETVLIGVHILSKKGDCTTVPNWFLMLKTLQNLRRVFCLFTVIAATHAPFSAGSQHPRDLSSVANYNVRSTSNVDMTPPTPPQPNLRNCVFQKRAFYEHGFRSAGKNIHLQIPGAHLLFLEVPRSFSQEPTWEKANKALGKVAHAGDDLRARSAVPSPYVSITCGKASPDNHR